MEAILQALTYSDIGTIISRDAQWNPDPAVAAGDIEYCIQQGVDFIIGYPDQGTNIASATTLNIQSVRWAGTANPAIWSSLDGAALTLTGGTITYLAGGRQFLVAVAGGSNGGGAELVAYALPLPNQGGRGGRGGRGGAAQQEQQ